MNLKDYIKSINQFLINEDFDEGTEEDMLTKVAKLLELQARLTEFIKKLEANQLTLEQVVDAVGQSANQNAAQAAPTLTPPALTTQPAAQPTA